jgi:acyl-CoA thioester hydrolase
MRSDFVQWHPITVRWRDMDSQNHVNNVTYFTYFEIARMEFFRSLGLFELMEPGKFGPAVVTQTCNYKRQTTFPSEIEVGVRPGKVTQRSFSVLYEVYLKGTDTLLVDGHTVMTWVDFVKEEAVPIPQELRERIMEMGGVATTNNSEPRMDTNGHES